ncbi:hypothetical protein BT69DRAFT_1333264 [Atractiella rhizophila]|nr:hypothetical protein BT69DRAFT_1333264 [Atractiella rhizophila]
MPFGDQGLFVTCPRGKERTCMNEMLPLLHEYLEPYISNQGTQGEEEAEGEEEEKQGGEEEDIEAQIARELNEIKQASLPSKRTIRVHRTSSECLCLFFLSRAMSNRPDLSITALITRMILDLSTPPIPVSVSEGTTEKSESEGPRRRSRFVQRIYPLEHTCSALSLDKVKRTAEQCVVKAFGDAARREEPIKYRIELTIRNHDKPLSRSVIFDIFASILSPADKSQPTAAPLPIASLKPGTADLIVLVTVHENLFGVAVVDGKLWDGRGRRFNLQALAEEALAAKEKVTNEKA